MKISFPKIFVKIKKIVILKPLNLHADSTAHTAERFGSEVWWFGGCLCKKGGLLNSAREISKRIAANLL